MPPRNLMPQALRATSSTLPTSMVWSVPSQRAKLVIGLLQRIKSTTLRFRSTQPISVLWSMHLRLLQQAVIEFSCTTTATPTLASGLPTRQELVLYRLVHLTRLQAGLSHPLLSARGMCRSAVMALSQMGQSGNSIMMDRDRLQREISRGMLRERLHSLLLLL